jgi:hypothetical protein
MRTTAVGLPVLVLALTYGSLASGRASRRADAGAPPATPPLPACVQVATQSRYVPFGYNHIVVLTNGCSQVASCSVATDVNPTAQSVNVAPNVTTEVLTFMAAPGTTFTARVSCRMQ